jgi:hypothetical protein
MFDFLASLPATGPVLALGLAAGGFLLAVRVNFRLQRRRRLMSGAFLHRCAARN